jgi:hypothetical protein
MVLCEEKADTVKGLTRRNEKIWKIGSYARHDVSPSNM